MSDSRWSTAGIILAAGASSRMGQPKALLRRDAGQPLAIEQAAALRAGGCAETVIVLGSTGDVIAPQLPGERCIINRNWPDGRFTSIQCGLRSVPGHDGYVILPVDTVGVRADTVRLLLAAALDQRPRALRPFHDGRPGRILWICADVADSLISLPPSDTNLDALLAPDCVPLPVSDPAILRNVNTPSDWSSLPPAPPHTSGA